MSARVDRIGGDLRQGRNINLAAARYECAVRLHFEVNGREGIPGHGIQLVELAGIVPTDPNVAAGALTISNIDGKRSKHRVSGTDRPSPEHIHPARIPTVGHYEMYRCAHCCSGRHIHSDFQRSW